MHLHFIGSLGWKTWWAFSIGTLNLSWSKQRLASVECSGGSLSIWLPTYLLIATKEGRKLACKAGWSLLVDGQNSRKEGNAN
jgi:hypothetical protein